MASQLARRLSDEEVGTLVIALTMLLNENAAEAANTADRLAGSTGTSRAALDEFLAINERQQSVVKRLLSELEVSPTVTLDPG